MYLELESLPLARYAADTAVWSTSVSEALAVALERLHFARFRRRRRQDRLVRLRRRRQEVVHQVLRLRRRQADAGGPTVVVVPHRHEVRHHHRRDFRIWLSHTLSFRRAYDESTLGRLYTRRGPFR